MVSTAEDLTKALEAVAKETAEDKSELDPTSSEGSETKEASDEASKAKGKSTAVPYTRFKEVNDKLSAQAKAVEELNEKLVKRDEELSKMVYLLSERDQASRTVEKINELYTSKPELRELIDTLDAAVKGQEVAIEKAEDKKAEAEAKGDLKTVREIEKVTKQLETTKSELEKSLAETQADLILDKADRILQQYFDKLPEQYNEDDRKVLSDRMVDKINWDEIEKDPSKLNSVLARDFKSTVEWYGTPRGTNKAEVETKTEETTKEPTVEALRTADWGKMKVVKDAKGVEMTVPVVSDEDWTKALAAAIRKDNKR
jgi:predicted RNA-binding Zn ribbon-like protein